MIKATLVRGLLACTLFACGGTQDQTEVTTPPDMDGDYHQVAPVIIDSLDWNSEHLQFVDMKPPGSDTPSIMVTALGLLGNGELGELLQEQSRYPVSAAEIWRAATGDERVPDELLADHAVFSESVGGPLDWQNFDGSLVNKGKADFNVMFPLTQAATNTNDGNHCWTQSRLVNATVGPSYHRMGVHNCTSSNGDVLTNDPLATPCPPEFNANTTVRAGMHNGQGATYTGKICWGFAGSDFEWDCFAPVTVPALDGYYVTSMFKNGLAHHMGTGFQWNFPTVNCEDNLCQLGLATLAVGVHSFGSTACGF
jgi:hypothetical protein